MAISTQSTSGFKFAILLTMGATEIACGDETVIPASAEGFNDDEAGVGDTGFIQYDVGSGPLESTECLTNEKSGAYGYRYQCGGIFYAQVQYVFDSTLYTISIPAYPGAYIGNGYDDYGAPKVMACCGPYDDEQALSDQPQFALNCIADARETACSSIALALDAHALELWPSDRKDAVNEISEFVRVNIPECYQELGDNFPTPLLVGADSDTWTLPDIWVQPDLGGVELLYYTYITDIYAPGKPDTCTDLSYNNVYPFLPDATPLDITFDLDLDEAEGVLLGPAYGGGRIRACDDFASLTTSCTPPFCSHARVSEDAYGGWSIDDMTLFVDGPLVISNGTLSATINDARLELVASVPGYWTTVRGQTYYQIAAGDAIFLAAGEGSGEAALMTVQNSTAITATSGTGATWSFDSFDVEFVDDTSDTWTVTVQAATWLAI